jgi:hypothetical protein
MCGWCGFIADTQTEEDHGAQRTIEVAGTATPVRVSDPAGAGWGEVYPFDRWSCPVIVDT